MRLGKAETRFDNIGQRIKNVLFMILPQRCTLRSVTKKDLAGFGHALLFWGFSCFLVSYIVFVGLAQGFGLYPWLMGNTFETVFSSILDIAGLCVMVAVIWGAIRRYVVRPERLEMSVEAGVIMMLVFSLIRALFLYRGLRAWQAQEKFQTGPRWGGLTLARFLSGTDIAKSTLTDISHGAWSLHYLLILAFTVYIPRSKHLHILASGANILFKPLKSMVVLEPIPLEALEAMESEGSVDLGVSKIQDFTWKDLLDLRLCCVRSMPCQLPSPYQRASPFRPKR